MDKFTVGLKYARRDGITLTILDIYTNEKGKTVLKVESSTAGIYVKRASQLRREIKKGWWEL